LSRWEKSQGIDPNQGSGHEKRPPSASRDAAQLRHAEKEMSLKEYIQWLDEMKHNPPWEKKKTPAQKVQGVTHPLGEEVGTRLLEELLKNSGSTFGKALGYGIKGGGLPFSILTDVEDAW